jgi:enoyl-CoA hydratase/carnithine racemase
MTQGSIELVRDGAVATLRFANPPRHTLTGAMVLAMHEKLAELEQDRAGARVLVVRSATPSVFITHYEVGELASIAEQSVPAAASATGGTPATRLHPLNELMLRLEALDLITVAVIDGLAMGGGCELALGCDFRLLRDGEHVIGLPETGVGIIPGAGGTQRLARLLGTARALDLVLHGTLLSPRAALAAGVVHRVYDAASFESEVASFIANLASRAPIALAQAKRAIRGGVALPLREGLLLEQEAFGRTLASADARGAMRAYLKGQPYEFKGE